MLLHALAGAPESHSPFEPGKAGTVRMVVNARGKGRFQGAGPALDLATCSPWPHPLPLLHLQATMLRLPPACCGPCLVTPATPLPGAAEGVAGNFSWMVDDKTPKPPREMHIAEVTPRQAPAREHRRPARP